MAVSRKRLLLVVLLASVFAGGGAVWYRIRESRKLSDVRELLSRFPAQQATVVNIDFAALRHTGLLEASKAPLEPEYKQFLDGTGFDYRRDLDYVVASLFSPGGNFFIARGRFDWNKLHDYAIRQGGSCYRQLCRVQGSTPERRISFLPLRGDVIALAVSSNDLAATWLQNPGAPITSALPSSPVWISLPGDEFRKEGALPPDLRMTLSALQTADRVVITFQPALHGIEAHLEATCHTADDAKVLASQLRSATAMLKQGLSRDKQAGNDELTATLAQGSFDQSDRKVIGKWPISKELIETLTAGV